MSNPVKEQSGDKITGLVMQIVWLAMIIVLAASIVLQHVNPGSRTGSVVELLTDLYLALIPVGVLVLAVVLLLRKLYLSAVVATILSIIWVLLRFVIK